MEKNLKYWLKAGFHLVAKRKDSSAEGGKEPKVSEQAVDRNVPIERKDYISYRTDIIACIITSLDKRLGESSINPSEYLLQVYIRDPFFYEYCVKEGFVEELAGRMSGDRGYVFDVRLLLPKSKDELISAVPVTKAEDVYMTLQRKNVTSQTTLARISVLAGYGSLLDEPVTLDGNRLSGGRANIGVGKQPRLADGSVRINTVAIDDDCNSPQHEYNKYVSRSHANIQFKDGHFVLFVELGGTSNKGKRTAVSRNGELIKLDIAGVGIPLEDGDQIILSKNVILLFEKEKND